MKNVLFFVGTRPEVIKMAPLVSACRLKGRLGTLLVSTGQQRHLVDQALQMFELKADVDFDLMATLPHLAELASLAISRAASLITEIRPDAVVVQGDTTTAFAAAMAGFYCGVPVAHLEAGLRTGDLKSPYPEEAHRQLIARLATFHFCPTASSRDALLKENIDSRKVFVTGNTVVDALRLVDETGRLSEVEISPEIATLKSQYRLILATGHRRENFEGGLDRFCAALKRIVTEFPDVAIVFPVHPNPTARSKVVAALKDSPRILLCDPISYFPFLRLLRDAALVITDSGGIQEEAPSFQTPVVVVRDTTERTEGVDSGHAILAGTDADSILGAARTFLNRSVQGKSIGFVPNPYGDGFSAGRIEEILSRHL